MDKFRYLQGISRYIKSSLVLALFLCSSIASAQVVSTGVTKIYNISSYAEFGSGDMIVYVDAPHANCSSGFWLSPDDPGFYSNLSLVLSGFQNQTNVKLLGNDDQIWPGSPTGTFCRLYMVTLVR